MSGSSTLRICLAAMAPALTEAASARLKLQDTSVRNEPPTRNTDITEHSVASRLLPSGKERSARTKGDLNFPSKLGGSKEGQLSHLSFVNVKTDNKVNGTHFDPEARSPRRGNTKATQYQLSASIALPSKKLPGLTTVNLKESQFDQFYKVSEDFQISPVKDKDTFIENLKIMNQPQKAAEKQVDSNKVVDSGVAKTGLVSFKRSDPLKSGMVNGDNDDLREKSENRLTLNECNEKGDAGLGRSILEGLASKLSNREESLKQSSSMGVYIKEDKLLPHVESEGSSKFEVKEVHMEEKMNEEMRKDCMKKQAYLEKKVDTLLRRMKRMKGKVVEAHTKEQLRQFVNYQHRNLQMVAKTIKKEAPGPEELKEHFLSNEEVKNMSTAQLVKLVKTHQSNKPVAPVDNSSMRVAMGSSSSAVFMDPSIRSQASRTSERLAHSIQTARSELDSDATASSSGGESGDEDGIPSQLPSDVALPALLKRAEWKWAKDRAAVVSRWTWLQAQVSDLEYRIRQQSQVYRQLRNSKGGVVLGDPPTPMDILRRLQGLPVKNAAASSTEVKSSVPATDSTSPGSEVSPCNVSAVLSNIDKQASRLTQSLGNCLSPANSTLGSPAGSSSKISPMPCGNNTTDSPAGSTTDADTTRENSPMVPTELRLPEKFGDLLTPNISSAPSDASCQAARCRPLRSYRKRKILKTIGLYKSNLKAARLSDVKCRCYPPSGTCPMCGGRYNNTQIVDADTMCFKEKVAILDPSFHPVLSFPQDVHLPIHCEGLLKSGLWQNKPPPRKSRMNDYRRQKVITFVTEPARKNGNGSKQNGRNNSAASVINFSAKIKNKYESKTKGKKSATSKGAPVKTRVKKVQRKGSGFARNSLKKHRTEEEDDDLEGMYLDQDAAPPGGLGREGHLSASGSQSSLKDLRDGHGTPGQRRRKVDNSYDINNIVIPLSMAANTRVEQPQYKEIVTPKWREVNESAASECAEESNSLTRCLEKTNGVSLPGDQHSHQGLTDLSDEEDLSDEKFAARHAVLEQEEKKRFRSFVQYPPVRRGRARSEVLVDVKEETTAECQGKPAGDGLEPPAGLSTISESDSSCPTTPMLSKSHPVYSTPSQDDGMDSLQQQLASRRRAQSFSRRGHYDDLHNHLIGVCEPYPRRVFPLSEEEYRLMKEEAPSCCEPVHQRVTRRLAEPSGKVYVSGGDAGDEPSAAPSPHPSNESMSSAGDDPNDPEWVGGGSGGDSVVSSAIKRIRQRRIVDDDPNDPEWNGSDHPKKGKNKR
ncbi:KAT8 regulatory NSL complex subunit 1 [Aplysia californica]|uniref:KAT8 regulatory NSL complex subunit 1 n=1 Tax=Aplysia californica TaxID=6500 RepID=A0ABM0JEM0_APLCA|nr:KAT8 regulatory NSL complex subunit 1 [Aplysia californica]